MNHNGKETDILTQLPDKSVTDCQENPLKQYQRELRNSNEVSYQNHEAPIFTTDVPPRKSTKNLYHLTT